MKTSTAIKNLENVAEKMLVKGVDYKGRKHTLNNIKVKKGWSLIVDEFEQYCAAKLHSYEIKTSRVGGLGGSDAAMVLKIGRNGLQSLCNTDVKRLRVMLGLDEPCNFGGNAATEAGHAFEDFIAERLKMIFQQSLIREAKMIGDEYTHFTTFAHADLLTSSMKVIECKFVQGTTNEVLSKYYAQLQWYYYIGADCVTLCHGVGKVEPFEVIDYTFLDVPRDEQAIDAIRNGLRLIDEYCSNEQEVSAPSEVEMQTKQRLLVRKYITRKRKVDMLTAEMDKIKAELQEEMEKNNIAKISGTINSDSAAVVIFRKGSTRRTLDTTKALARYPELNEQGELWKTTTAKSSLTIQIKENNESKNN